MSRFGKFYGRNSAEKELPAWKEKFWTAEATLLTGQDKSQNQGNGSTLDFLWDTYSQCGMYDRKNREKKGWLHNQTKIRRKKREVF